MTSYHELANMYAGRGQRIVELEGDVENLLERIAALRQSADTARALVQESHDELLKFEEWMTDLADAAQKLYDVSRDQRMLIPALTRGAIANLLVILRPSDG